jgi:hypothetical protein
MERDRNSVNKLILKTKTIQCSRGEQSRGTDKYRGGYKQVISADARDEGRQVCVMEGRSV